VTDLLQVEIGLPRQPGMRDAIDEARGEWQQHMAAPAQRHADQRADALEVV
jgi:hypothetical protein